MKNFLLWLLLSVCVIACASATKQTDAYLKAPHGIPVRAEIAGVPFINQSLGQCGPATLAMELNWSGNNILVEDLAPQVYSPKAKGSFQADMVSASRRNGMLAVSIGNLDSLFSEIAAGNPVIVFENLSVAWLPRWHYALVFGYDLEAETVTMHSGPEAFKHWDMRKFERSWELGDYWGLVVLPPGRLSQTADETSQTRATAALEQIGKFNEALLSYKAILKRWPKSLGAHIGLANIAFEKGDAKSASQYLNQAAVLYPESAAVWHNLAIAEGALKNVKAAKKSAAKAIKYASASEKPDYLKSLAQWL